MSVETTTLRADKTVMYVNRFTGETDTSSSRFVSDYWRDEKPDRDRSRKTSGWLYPKPYKRDIIRRTNVHGRVAYKYSYYEDLYESGPLSSVAVPTDSLLGFQGWMLDAAMIQALQKLKDQKVNLGVALAEAQQTADFLGSTASRVARGLNQLSSGHWRQAASTLGASWRKAPQTWLELQYAAKPFMQDVYGSFSELARSDPGQFALTCKGTSSDTEDETIILNDGTVYGSMSRVRRFGGVFVRLDFLPSNNALAALARSGLINPIEVAWEKVPFSFVVDWFYTVGDSLSVLDATEGFQFLSGSWTDRRETTVSVSPSPNGGSYIHRSFEGNYRQFHLERTPISELPAFIKPRFKNPLSLGHMANGLSLLATAAQSKGLRHLR